MVIDGQKGHNVRNYKFLAKYLFQYFQIFSIFISYESLPMKSCQFFKIYKRFDRERVKTLKQQLMSEKRKIEKSWTFISG